CARSKLMGHQTTAGAGRRSGRSWGSSNSHLPAAGNVGHFVGEVAVGIGIVSAAFEPPLRPNTPSRYSAPPFSVELPEPPLLLWSFVNFVPVAVLSPRAPPLACLERPAIGEGKPGQRLHHHHRLTAPPAAAKEKAPQSEALMEA